VFFFFELYGSSMLVWVDQGQDVEYTNGYMFRFPMRTDSLQC
jgi:hypothetical protein